MAGEEMHDLLGNSARLSEQFTASAANAAVGPLISEIIIGVDATVNLGGYVGNAQRVEDAVGQIHQSSLVCSRLLALIFGHQAFRNPLIGGVVRETCRTGTALMMHASFRTFVIFSWHELSAAGLLASSVADQGC